MLKTFIFLLMIIGIAHANIGYKDVLTTALVNKGEISEYKYFHGISIEKDTKTIVVKIDKGLIETIEYYFFKDNVVGVNINLNNKEVLNLKENFNKEFSNKLKENIISNEYVKQLIFDNDFSKETEIVFDDNLLQIKLESKIFKTLSSVSTNY